MTSRLPRPRRARSIWAAERVAWKMGYTMVAGLDEVGMGPLAGPVVAGAVILPAGCRLPGIGDSKVLTPIQRARLDRAIRGCARAVSVFGIAPTEVDSRGLTMARRSAMAGALAGLGHAPDYLLIDAFDLPEAPLPQLALVRGDSTCISIMAASIVAKVARDRLMEEYDLVYPGYGFASHKGYATASHREALRRLGPSPIHRMSWTPIREAVTLLARRARDQ